MYAVIARSESATHVKNGSKCIISSSSSKDELLLDMFPVEDDCERRLPMGGSAARITHMDEFSWRFNCTTCPSSARLRSCNLTTASLALSSCARRALFSACVRIQLRRSASASSPTTFASSFTAARDVNMTVPPCIVSVIVFTVNCRN